MIQNLIKKAPFLLGMGVLILSSLAFQSANSSEQREIAAAKAWFDTNIKPTAKVLPDWSDVEVRKNKGNTILDIAVNSRVQSFHMTEQKRANGDKSLPNGSIRMIIKKDKDGNYDGGLLMVNGSSQYIRSYGQSGLKQIRLNPLNFQSKRFEGYAWLEDFTGKFKEGYYYENGTRKKQLDVSKNFKSNQLVPRFCYTTSYWVESYGTDSDGVFYVSTFEVVILHCTFVGGSSSMEDVSNSDDWIYNSGSSGNGSEQNNDPVGCQCKTNYKSTYLTNVINGFYLWSANIYVNLSGITCNATDASYNGGYHTQWFVKKIA